MLTGTDVAIIIAAVILGAAIKSVTGMGLPLIATPIAALFMPTETIVAVLAIPNTIQNVVLSVRHRHAYRGDVGLIAFCLVGAVGAGIGAFAITVVSDWVAKTGLAIIIAVYLVMAFRGREPKLADRTAGRWRPPVALVAGIFQGGIGISGPLVAGWYRALRLGRDGFVFAIATTFAVSGLVQAIVLGTQGRYEGRLTLAAVLTLIVTTTVPIGQRIRPRIAPGRFDQLVLGLVGIAWVSVVGDLVFSGW